jgi:hypothetical protein
LLAMIFLSDKMTYWSCFYSRQVRKGTSDDLEDHDLQVDIHPTDIWQSLQNVVVRYHQLDFLARSFVSMFDLASARTIRSRMTNFGGKVASFNNLLRP